MNSMKVYISGKIGEEVISDATREKFARAQAMLEAKGYEVFNPVSEKWQNYLHRQYEKDRKAEEPWIEGTFPDFYAYVLLRDQMVLATKDAVYFLDDWDRSKGSGVEQGFAIAVGKPMLWQSEADARLYYDMNDGCKDWKEVWLPL